MSLPLTLVSFLALGRLHIILGDNYQFESNCVPACTSSSAPLTDKQPCMCRPDFNPAGCRISPCGPGEDASFSYTCQCTEYFQPYQCVTLTCDNGTNSYGTSCPSSSYSSFYYPSESYPSQNYPTASYQSPQHGNGQPSYSLYQSNYTCNNYCVCESYLPAECTEDSIPPIISGLACACNQNYWPTGCTFQPCQSTDTGDDNYYCECTSTNSPWFCFSPRCTSS